MKNTKILLIIYILFLCTGCPDQDDKPDSIVTILNNSSEDILHFVEFRALADTALPVNSIYPSSQNISIGVINAISKREYTDSWIKGFKDSPGKVLMLYLFSRDTIEQVSWDRIVDEYLILRRYDLTLKDLEDMNWTINYP